MLNARTAMLILKLETVSVFSMLTPPNRLARSKMEEKNKFTAR